MVIRFTSSTLQAYPSIPAITILLPLISMVSDSGLMIVYPKGSDDIPLTHRKQLPTGIKGPQLLSQYAELPNAVEIITAVP